MDKLLLGDGIHPSITFHDGHIKVAWQDRSVMVIATVDPLTMKLEGEYRELVNGASAAYCEIYGNYRSYRDGAEPYFGRFGLIAKRPESLGQIHGSRPSVFGEGQFAYIAGGANEGYPVRQKPVDAAGAGTVVRHAAGTGLSRISGGHVFTIDEDRNAVPGISDPSWAGDAVVGTTDVGGKPALKVLRAGKECVVAAGEDSQNPRMATDGHAYFITAWSGAGQGVRLWRVVPEDFKAPDTDYTRTPSDLPANLGTRYAGYYLSHSKNGEFWPEENCPVLALSEYDGSEGRDPEAARKMTDALELNQRYIIKAERDSLDLASPYWENVAAVLIGEYSTVDAVRNAVSEAKILLEELDLPARPIMSTLMVPQTTDAAYDETADTAGCEIYFGAPPATHAEMEKQVADRINEVLHAHSGKIMLIVQSYDRSNPKWTSGMLEAIQYAAAVGMNRSTRIVGCIWFAYGRKTGVVDHPELIPWQAAIVARCRVPAAIEDPEPPNPEPPPEGEDMTHEELRNAANSIPNDILFGAFKRLHDEVLPRDRALDGAIKSGAWTEGDLDMWTGDFTTGGAMSIFCRTYFPEYSIAIDKGRTPAEASGDAYDKGIAAYRAAVNPQKALE